MPLLDDVNSFDYRVHRDLNLIEVRPAGVVQVSDILAYAREALSLDLVTEGTIEYYDLSGASNLNFDFKSALGLTEVLREWLSRGWEGSVYFAPREVQFGMIRMISAVLEGIDDAPQGMMIPRREPISLAAVRISLPRAGRSRSPRR